MTERKWGWIPDPPDPRDKPYKAISPQAARLTEVVYLIRPNVKDQLDLGSCVFNGLLSQMESVMIGGAGDPPAILPPLELSRLFAYWNYRRTFADINQDEGAHPRDALKLLKKNGACPEREWPYVPKKFALEPPLPCWTSAEHYKIKDYHALEDLGDMLECINDGWPFGAGLVIRRSFMSAEAASSGEIALPAPGEEFLGRHYVFFWGYDRHAEIFFGQNSWGEKWGQKGRFTIPFSYLANPALCGDRWTVRTMM